VEEIRDYERARDLADRIRAAVTKPWKIMEVCGAQTNTILRYGIDQMLPREVEIVHGPGCSVCMTPLEMIDRAIAIAREPDVIFCAYGEMLRIPGSNRTDLLEVKAADGADVRVVYSPLDCLEIAKLNPQRKVVFLAIGFDGAVPNNALSMTKARQFGINNYFVLSWQALMSSACSFIANSPANQVQAFLGPGSACSITGFREYEALSRQHHIPVVITGLEPIDVLEGIYKCVLQLESGKASVENQYSRAVTKAGNQEAQALVNEVFEVGDRNWRRLGQIPRSGYRINDRYRNFDAEQVFNVGEITSRGESSVCISDQILCGFKKPMDCSAFGKSCNPQHPIGATMVSPDGTCALYCKFRFQESEHKQAV
jgi:hydrogenase expression/formation protein HypD